MSENDYYVRLNQSPLPTLPFSEGEKAGLQFTQYRDPFLADNPVRYVTSGKGDPGATFCGGYMGIKDSKVVLYTIGFSSMRELPKPISASFAGWSPTYKGKKEEPGIPNQRIGDFTFSRGRALKYPDESICKNESSEGREEILPLQILGVISTDWDQDGDHDVAVFLQGGVFVFYKSQSCEDGVPVS